MPHLPKGSWPVMFTPFTDSGEIDLDCLDDQVEFYLQTGQSGLFATALSGEVFDLTDAERLLIPKRLVEKSAGRLPIVASGNFGDTIEDQARSIETVADTGVDAVIVLISALPSPENLAEQILDLAEKTKTPLGLYECPKPEHRLLTEEDVRKIAGTGRFVFMKETSRTVPTYTAKLKAAEGSPMRVYQANLRCAPGSLENGADGLCGIFSNFCPEWSARFCEIGAESSEERDALFRSLVAFHDAALKYGYPASGKYILQKRGMPIRTFSRQIHSHPFGETDKKALDRFLAECDIVHPAITPERLDNLLREMGNPPLLD